MEHIKDLNKTELEQLLKNLRFYKDLTKKVGNRGKIIFEREYEGRNDFLVEYYGDIDESYVLTEAKDVYKKVFNIDVDTKDIKLVKNENIKGGIKVYLNDDLVDLSFLKFYNILK